MSYDLNFFHVPQGMNPLTAYNGQTEEREHKLLVRPCGSGSSGSIDPSKEVAKRRLADLLIMRYPEFEIFQYDYREIAKMKSIDESEARRRYRDIQLTHPSGLQIVLFDDTAAVTIPYWPNATSSLSTAWEHLKTLATEGEFSVHDPQLGRILNLDTDLDIFRNTFSRMTRIVGQKLK